MYKIICVLLLCLAPIVGRADLIEEEPMYDDNTGALGTGDNQADIVEEGGSNLAGAIENEITLKEVDDGIEVYSGFNRVERIVTGSDGWVGKVDVQSSKVMFRPAGRPELECPSQTISGWYGPCKIPEAS